VEKIVVTGSCGFIGYNFIKSNSSNFKIIGIDSLNNAYDNRLKELRLSSLNEEPNFTFKLLNLSDANTLDKESEIFENVSTVLHLGARAGVRQSFLDPTSYILDNTAATANLALNVKKHKVKKFIVASTSSIYGDTGVGYAKENKDELENPPSIYAATKSFGEVLTRNILEDTDTIIQIPRFFTVYGPFGRPDMSILRFIHWISTNQEVIIYGDGEQKRSFTFISDIISGLNKLFIHNDSGIFNFGSNETWSLNQVINLIEKKLNKKAIIVNRERAIKDVDIVLPSLELSKSKLNWEPTTNIEDGISATVEWYKNNENELKEIKFKYDYEK
tara:strand:+ start:1052 stop:2044 length:993 start_codon:yes stop_codon:yes gene_type:complete